MATSLKLILIVPGPAALQHSPSCLCQWGRTGSATRGEDTLKHSASHMHQHGDFQNLFMPSYSQHYIKRGTYQKPVHSAGPGCCQRTQPHPAPAASPPQMQRIHAPAKQAVKCGAQSSTTYKRHFPQHNRREVRCANHNHTNKSLKDGCMSACACRWCSRRAGARIVQIKHSVNYVSS